MSDSLTNRMKAANELLDYVSLITYKDSKWISLRGSKFPPKPGDPPGKRYTLPTGCSLTPGGVKKAIAIAQKVNAELELGEFDWANHLKGSIKNPQNCGHWIERLEHEYWQKRPKTHAKLSTWRYSYWVYLNALPQNEPLTLELLEEYLCKYPAQKSQRKKASMAYGMLAELAGLNRSRLRELGRGYNPSGIAANAILDDDRIVEVVQGCQSPVYQWCAGMCASFGLRPHELIRLDASRLAEGVVRVLENSKTGERFVYAVPFEWVELFKLIDIRQPKTHGDRANKVIGSYFSSRFRYHGLPTPYQLRDSYAIRCETLQVASTATIAEWMGHSIAVHEKNYLDALRAVDHDRIYKRYRESQTKLRLEQLIGN